MFDESKQSKNPAASELLRKREGRSSGVGRLDDEVEAVIQELIAGYYLKRQRPRVVDLYRQIALSCRTKATNATMQTIAFTSDTKYLRGSSPVTLKAIKVGDHVVIHATKKSDQLTAAEVRIGAMKAGALRAMQIGRLRANARSCSAAEIQFARS